MEAVSGCPGVVVVNVPELPNSDCDCPRAGAAAGLLPNKPPPPKLLPAVPVCVFVEPNRLPLCCPVVFVCPRVLLPKRLPVAGVVVAGF